MTQQQTTVRALIVEPNGTKRVREVGSDLASMQAVVGGPIEYIYVTPGVYAYCNEEGKYLRDCAPNPAATELVGLTGYDVVMGTVIFLGEGSDGEDGDLPTEWLEAHR